MTCLLIAVGTTLYIGGFLLMSTLLFASTGFASGGPGLLAAIWYTFFWPVALPVAGIPAFCRRRR